MSIINWVKAHKFLILVALIIAYLLRSSIPTPIGMRTSSSVDVSSSAYNTGAPMPMGKPMSSEIGMTSPSYQQVSDSSERVVIQESNLSLLVKNVRETGNKIINAAKSMGGYMVNTSYNDLDGQAFATISVRVPTDKLDQALEQFRGFAVKVTNENLVGTDVTQEYQDLDQRIATIKATKSKFEEILKRGTTVTEILEVNREIINLEQQIDSATGQKMAIADNARLTKITIYLSTDELALPYTPDKVFRPDVVFKLAVRSLLGSVQSFAEFLIWAGVFAVIWVPLLIILIVFKNWRNRSRQNPKSRLN